MFSPRQSNARCPSLGAFSAALKKGPHFIGAGYAREDPVWNGNIPAGGSFGHPYDSLDCQPDLRGELAAWVGLTLGLRGGTDMKKQAQEARRLASRTTKTSFAKACLQLANEFDKLAEKYRRLDEIRRLRRPGR
jgi:hypothetical protein